MKVRRTPDKAPFDISRRQILTGAAGSLLLGAFPKTVSALDDDDEQSCRGGLCDFPVPIPHINIPPPGGAHHYFPGPVSGAPAATDPSGAHPEGRDPIHVFNFKGVIGQADLMLTGTGTDLETGATAPYKFHTDLRFLNGVFVGTDLIERRASFAFV